MSAWMVSNRTLSEFANLIDTYRNVDYNGFGFDFPEMLINEFRHDTAKEIFNKLAEMNIEALKQRYNNPDDLIGYVEYIPDAYIYKPRENGLTYHWQLLKSLHCYIYQCSEGNVPDCNLYKAIEKLISYLSDYIINKIPEYQAAEWK